MKSVDCIQIRHQKILITQAAMYDENFRIDHGSERNAGEYVGEEIEHGVVVLWRKEQNIGTDQHIERIDQISSRSIDRVLTFCKHSFSNPSLELISLAS